MAPSAAMGLEFLTRRQVIVARVDLRDSPEEQQFRAELRDWLATVLPTLPAKPDITDWPGRREYDQAGAVAAIEPRLGEAAFRPGSAPDARLRAGRFEGRRRRATLVERISRATDTDERSSCGTRRWTRP